MQLPQLTRVKLLFLAITCLVAAWQVACSVGKQVQNPLPTAIMSNSELNIDTIPTPTRFQVASDSEIEVATSTAASRTDIPDSGWQPLALGLERRIIRNQLDGTAAQEKFYLLRIDPEYFEFDVGYQPGESQRLSDWLAGSEAIIVVNGGYFTNNNLATGLVISNGVVHGTSYQGFGGMLAVTADGPELRSLVEKPYTFQEGIVAGLQSFPMLVLPGNQLAYTEEDDLAARRTVIAQDNRGRFLFILATTGTYTLHKLAQFLVFSDLDLEIALNLDGGSSTGLLLADPVDGVAPFTLLPVVIRIYSK